MIGHIRHAHTPRRSTTHFTWYILPSLMLLFVITLLFVLEPHIPDFSALLQSAVSLYRGGHNGSLISALILVPSFLLLPCAIYCGRFSAPGNERLFFTISAAQLLVPKYPLLHFCSGLLKPLCSGCPQPLFPVLVSTALVSWQSFAFIASTAALALARIPRKELSDIARLESEKRPPLTLFRSAVTASVFAFCAATIIHISDNTLGLYLSEIDSIQVVSLQNIMDRAYFENNGPVFYAAAVAVLILFTLVASLMVIVSSYFPGENLFTGSFSDQSSQKFTHPAHAFVCLASFCALVCLPLCFSATGFVLSIISFDFASWPAIDRSCIRTLLHEIRIAAEAAIPLLLLPTASWFLSNPGRFRSRYVYALISASAILSPVSIIFFYILHSNHIEYPISIESVYHYLKIIPLSFAAAVIMAKLRTKHEYCALDCNPVLSYIHIIRPLFQRYYAGLIMFYLAWTMSDHRFQASALLEEKSYRLFRAISETRGMVSPLTEFILFLSVLIPAVLFMRGLWLIRGDMDD